MNLYRLTQNVNNDYDTYDSAIVAAESKEKAVTISPGSFYTWDEGRQSWVFSFTWQEPKAERDHTWALPSEIECELLGVAGPDIKEGLIMSSFNAG